MNAWIGVDLDGTLAHYDKWVGPEIGPPVELMVNRVKEMLGMGVDVRIFTARITVEPIPARLDQERRIREWCRLHLECELPITATKDLFMVQLYDDRCVQIVPNTGMTVEEHRQSQSLIILPPESA
jgi:hypothetical protein